MNKFKLGIPEMDANINFHNNDFITIAGRPAMGKTSFALNILLQNNLKGCIISLRENEDFILNNQTRFIVDASAEKITDVVKNNFVFLELPSLIELLELIASLKDKYDYFIVDEMIWIDNNINPLFADNKNYQSILRHLKVLCNAMNKNIVLLSNVDRKIEDGEMEHFSHYGVREKYLDYIFLLHRPNYYGISEDSNGAQYDDSEMQVHVVKSRTPISTDCYCVNFSSSMNDCLL